MKVCMGSDVERGFRKTKVKGDMRTCTGAYRHTRLK